MFTLAQIEHAHDKVRSGSDFPGYIQEIKKLGATAFETWVSDSHTEYFGKGNFHIKSPPKYKDLPIAENSDKEKFATKLRIHQQGETDYLTFCRHCAVAGVEKWVVSLEQMTCTYYDRAGNTILVETIPSL